MAKPTNQSEWQLLRAEVFDSFTPGKHIKELSMFAGRRDVVQRLQDVAQEEGRNAIIFGEKGVGKTSLAEVFHKGLNVIDAQSGVQKRSVVAIHVNADTKDSFDSLWRKVFRRINRPNSSLTVDLDYTGPIEPDHVVLELERFTPNQMPIVIIDEYDRIEEIDCRVLVTDLIKALTLCRNNPTIVLVGIAENIMQLVHDHSSIAGRNLVQVHMKRMSRPELRQIVTTRLRRIGMEITEDALWRVEYFSAGLPAYAHSLGKFAAFQAIKRQRITIDEGMVLEATHDCMSDVDYTIVEAYSRATERIYRKDNLFREVLAACALAETNDLGQFTAASIELPLSAIRGEPMKVSSFAFHLNEMSGPARGNVLQKSGARRTFKYQFTEAAMQPYVVMKSLADEVIKSDVMDRFRISRQRSLSI